MVPLKLKDIIQHEGEKHGIKSNKEIKPVVAYLPVKNHMISLNDYNALLALSDLSGVKLDDIKDFTDEDNYGIITFDLPKGQFDVELAFEDTKVRRYSKFISLAGLMFIGLLLIIKNYSDKQKAINIKQ